MKRATCLIRAHSPERRAAFVSGLEACGYTVDGVINPNPTKDEVLLVWNRSVDRERTILDYEKAGATVLVAENGFIGTDENQHRLYSLFLNHHNGAGRWHVGAEDRWSRLGIDLLPWREDGKHILLLPQRGIGERGVGMPPRWTSDTHHLLSTITKRPLRIRQHPGKAFAPLEPDLRNCWAAVTWGSGAAIKAIVAGVPVFYDLKRWIGGSAACWIQNIERPFLGDRMPMLHRLSWAQWSLSELASGVPFEHLLKLR